MIEAEFSQRVGRLMHTTVMLSLTAKQRIDFTTAIELAESYKNLSKSHQRLIKKAETELNLEGLNDKQLLLGVLDLIVTSWNQKHTLNNILIPHPALPAGMENDMSFSLQQYIMQRRAVDILKDKNLIKIMSDGDSLNGVRVNILDLSELLKLHDHLFESIPLHGNLTRIVYSSKSGKGKVNGVDFRLYRSINKKIFDKLVNQEDLRVSKSDVVKSLKHRNLELKSKAFSSEFNTIISNLRQSLIQLDNKSLVVEENHIKLNVDLHLTD